MGQDNTGQQATNRPSVLENVSTSQMEELEEHYNGGDRSAWDALIESYGWSKEDGDAVWQWFTERPQEGSDAFSGSAG